MNGNNVLHSAMLLLNIIIGSLLTFDWTTLGLGESTAKTVAGVVVMLSGVITFALNQTGNGATGVK